MQEATQSFKAVPNTAKATETLREAGSHIAHNVHESTLSDSPTTEAESHTILGKLKRAGIILAQLVVLIAIYEVGCIISRYLPIAIPGNIVGMALLLILLATGVLKGKHIGGACDYMIDNMSIFFIPAGVGIMGCFTLLQDSALKFAFVCIVTTVIVFIATSATVIATSRLVNRVAEKRAASPSPETRA